MRVLLTGGREFLGSRVLSLLGDHDVLCLSRDPARLPVRDGMKAVVADLGTNDSWIDAIAEFRPECRFHLAWEGLPDYALDRCRFNLDAGIRLLGAVAQSDVRRMIVAGSCWEYGRVSGATGEDRPAVDEGVFAATKHAPLTVLQSVARERGLP